MSTGLYSHTSRAAGTILTASIYNTDHTNHVTNQNPLMTGAYSDDVTQMRSTASPGGIGTEVLAGSLAGELERLRFVLKQMKGTNQWYETGTGIQLQGFTLAGLPAAGTAGRLARVTDDIRGLYIDNGLAWEHLVGRVIDVRRDFQARGNDLADETSALQAAITQGATSGVPVFIPPGTYRITSALTSPSPVRLIGLGFALPVIRQMTAGADVLVLGQNNANSTFNYISGIEFRGGNRGLRLNNVQASYFSNLRLNTNTVGLYTEGQLETSVFDNLIFDTYSTTGISTGNVNGGASGGGFNFPIIQKCDFRRLRFTGASGSTAIIFDAGVLGAQQTSGYTSFKGVTVQGAETRGFTVAHTNSLWISGMSNEQATLPLGNTSVLISLGTGITSVTIEDSSLAGRANDATTWKHVIEQIDGILVVKNVLVGVGAAGTADIRVAGLGATIVDSALPGGATTGVIFAGTAQQKSLLVNVRDSGGVPIVWPVSYPAIYGGTTTGTTLGQIRSIGGLSTAKGISGTTAYAENLRGSATFASAGTVAVAFGTAEPDAVYFVAISGSANETFWVTGKLTTGFTLNSSNAASTATVNWILIR